MADKKPLVRNTNDPEQVKKAEFREKFTRDQELDDVRAVLSTDAGRRFIWRYLGMCHIFQTSNHASGSQIYFNEGERNVGLKIFADMNDADPSAFVKMQLEKQGDKNG